MHNWKFMEWTENIEHGTTTKGFPFYQVGISGWNADGPSPNKEQLIRIRTVKNNLSITTHIDYLHPDARFNLNARRLAKEITFYLEDSFRDEFSRT